HRHSGHHQTPPPRSTESLIPVLHKHPQAGALVVTSNSSPDSSSGKRQTLQSPFAQGTYERGLATIPSRTLSRRVHAVVTHWQQSGKRRVMSEICLDSLQMRFLTASLDRLTAQLPRWAPTPQTSPLHIERVAGQVAPH